MCINLAAAATKDYGNMMVGYGGAGQCAGSIINTKSGPENDRGLKIRLVQIKTESYQNYSNGLEIQIGTVI